MNNEAFVVKLSAHLEKSRLANVDCIDFVVGSVRGLWYCDPACNCKAVDPIANLTGKFQKKKRPIQYLSGIEPLPFWYTAHFAGAAAMKSAHEGSSIL